MNPITNALGRVSNYFQGKSTVDNSANPGSAYSIKQRQIKNAGPAQTAQSKALQQAIKKSYAKKGQVFGTPLK